MTWVQGPDGDVVAQLMITYEWSDWRNAQVWWIQSVYVKPEHRRQGLFQSLYKHVKEASAKDGACGLRLYADFDNSKANSTVRTLLMKTRVCQAVQRYSAITPKDRSHVSRLNAVLTFRAPQCAQLI